MNQTLFMISLVVAMFASSFVLGDEQPGLQKTGKLEYASQSADGLLAVLCPKITTSGNLGRYCLLPARCW